MGWWRTRAVGAADPALAEALHQAYRLHTLEAALHAKQLEQLVTWFQAAGIDPLLSKGWAIARLYPEPGLRPYGDFDFCVSSEQYPAAAKIATEARGQGYPVDLHPGFRELPDRRFADLYVRSQSVQLGRVLVRLFGPEDHLRHLCIHLLSHGGWRPSWFCDLGALLEARPGASTGTSACTGARRGPVGSGAPLSWPIACSARPWTASRRGHTPAVSPAGSSPPSSPN